MKGNLGGLEPCSSPRQTFIVALMRIATDHLKYIAQSFQASMDSYSLRIYMYGNQ